MLLRTRSRPSAGGRGGSIGRPPSKKSIGDFTGSNFDGAHHLTKEKDSKRLSTTSQAHITKFIFTNRADPEILGAVNDLVKVLM